MTERRRARHRRAEPDRTQDPLRGSRTSGAWVGGRRAAALLVLLMVFIAQNTQDVHVSFLGWDGEAPLSVTLLIAAAIGIVVTAIVGTMRIWQLRRRVGTTARDDRRWVRRATMAP